MQMRIYADGVSLDDLELPPEDEQEVLAFLDVATTAASAGTAAEAAVAGGAPCPEYAPVTAEGFVANPLFHRTASRRKLLRDCVLQVLKDRWWVYGLPLLGPLLPHLHRLQQQAAPRAFTSRTTGTVEHLWRDLKRKHLPGGLVFSHVSHEMLQPGLAQPPPHRFDPKPANPRPLHRHHLLPQMRPIALMRCCPCWIAWAPRS